MCVFTGQSFIIARVRKRLPHERVGLIKNVVHSILSRNTAYGCDCASCKVIKEEVKKEPRLRKRRRISTT